MNIWNVVIGVALLVVILLWSYRIANRLDRLYVRTYLAHKALVAALDRRAMVARTVAAALRLRGDIALYDLGVAMAKLADLIEYSSLSFAHRENLENELSILLGKAAAVTRDINPPPTELIAELTDTQNRVIIARRFYNDAVRDTHLLSQRRLVRLLRLGGHAAMPEYFEIIE